MNEDRVFPEVEWTEDWKSEFIKRQCQSQSLN